MFNVYLLNPIENLRSYINNRPPLVIFMISVSAVAIAFLTIGYFFKIKEIKSPELTEDWNTFLLRFNELDFCVSENETIKHGLNESTTPESMVVTSGQARSSTQAPLLLEDSGPINISVPITLTLDPQRPFGGYSRNITHLYATVLGQQVGLSGREAHEEINITFTLPVSWNSDDCVLHGHCEQVVFSTCMTITAASNIFPVTVQPPHCVPETYTNATSWYKVFTTVRDSDTKYSQDYNPFWCYKGAIGKVYHALNPKLTVIVPDVSHHLLIFSFLANIVQVLPEFLVQVSNVVISGDLSGGRETSSKCFLPVALISVNYSSFLIFQFIFSDV
uniref:Transmembrane protein 248 n=1 Tax=Seriola dumerili TaxID=41447 RepID=A0A3B4U068_SERDU